MKSNNKAFTFIELLSMVLILSVILLISLPNIFNIINNKKLKDYNILIDSIEDGAKLYVNDYIEELEEELLNNPDYIHFITINQLKEKGLLKENLINPLNNEIISSDKKVFIFTDQHNILIYCFEDQECAKNLYY